MMRILLLLSVICLFFVGCGKDKYTSAPQIKYKSLSANVYPKLTTDQSPKVVFSITDAEGDLGDTAYIYIKNLLTNDSIQLAFPNLSEAEKKNFKGDVSASVGRLGGFSCNGNIE